LTGSEFWQVRSLADATELEAEPPAIAPRDAQPWCNFVLWMPAAIPQGCELVHGTLRRQAPPGRVADQTAGRTPWSKVNPACYRYEIAGAGRRLRVKQFLYDWAFPACDHPCLWNSPARPVGLDESYILWFGVDYKKNRAASARLARTTIELSVLAGEFTDAEIYALYRSMRPAVPDSVVPIARTPFALLSYWARYPSAGMVHVPAGLWKFRRTGMEYTGQWTADAAAIHSLLGEYRIPAQLGRLPADSAARFADAEGNKESEVVYAGGPDRRYELRLVVQRPGEGHIAVPAEHETHPHQAAQVEVAGLTVHLAWNDDRYGSWDATWSDSRAGLEAKLMASAGATLDRDWFLAAMAEIAASARNKSQA